MAAYNSYFLASTPGSNVNWFNSIQNVDSQINLLGTLARVTNADGSWTVFHGDIGGFSFDAFGNPQGTIRWITHTTATGGGFIGAAEFEAVGGVFDHINVSLGAFLASSNQGRYDLVFNSPMALNGDQGGNLLGGGVFGDIFNGGNGSDTADYSFAPGFVVADLAGIASGLGHANGDTYSSIENLRGSNFGDRLFGDGFGNGLTGLDGGDVLDGRAGGDTLDGGEGNDVLVGGTEGDFLLGGGGVDEADYSAAGGGLIITIADAAGNGTAVRPGFGADNFSGIENIRGGAGWDSINGNSADNTFWGNGGNDFLAGGDGSDTLDGGEGDDVFQGGTGVNAINGGGGVNTISYADTGIAMIFTLGADGSGAHAMGSRGTDFYVGIGNVEGGGGADRIIGNGFGNRLDGRNGNDELSGGDGADTLRGDLGDDTLQGGLGFDTIYGDSVFDFGGSDTISFANNVFNSVNMTLGAGGDGVVTAGFFDEDIYFGIENVEGTDLSDTISGNDGANKLWGRSGADTLAGGNGDDTLFGGDGFDYASYESAASAVVVDLGSGGPQNTGGAGTDSLADIEGIIGSAFNDVLLRGFAESVNLRGGGGDDTLHDFAGGSDAYEGGIGVNTMSYETSGFASVNASLLAGTAVSSDGSVDTLTNIQNLIGTFSGDSLTGDGAANSLKGGFGADAMAGGGGNDTYDVDNAGDAVSESLGQGYDVVKSTLAAYTLTANLERLIFTDGASHTGKGNALNNTLNGNAGDDRFLVDAGGADVFSGGGGSDSLDFRLSAAGAVINLATNVHGGAALGDTFASIEKFFGSSTAGDTMTAGRGRADFSGFGGNDTLTGGISIDKLSGGDGNDTLNGGANEDTLWGGKGNDTLTGGAGADLFVYVETVAAGGFGKDKISDFQDGLDLIKIDSPGVATSLAEFTIAGNGTSSVTLTLIGATSNTITLNGASPITITAADFLFY